MTPEVLKFVEKHKEKLKGKVIEIGSLNVNGSVRSVVDIAVGTDMRKGNGVDLVCAVENLPDHFKAGEFDGCVSTDTLEHVKDWKSFVRVTWDLVKEDGWLVLTMASVKKGRHAYPDDYWRMTEEHVKQIWPNSCFYTELGRVSIGWVVQKKGDLPNLDEIEPLKVK